MVPLWVLNFFELIFCIWLIWNNPPPPKKNWRINESTLADFFFFFFLLWIQQPPSQAPGLWISSVQVFWPCRLPSFTLTPWHSCFFTEGLPSVCTNCPASDSRLQYRLEWPEGASLPSPPPKQLITFVLGVEFDMPNYFVLYGNVEWVFCCYFALVLNPDLMVWVWKNTCAYWEGWVWFNNLTCMFPYFWPWAGEMTTGLCGERVQS